MDSNNRSKDNRDNDTGKFSVQYDAGNFVEALRRLDGSGSTKEVADEVGCSRRTAHYRMEDLLDNGQVSVREVGRSKLWQVIDDE